MHNSVNTFNPFLNNHSPPLGSDVSEAVAADVLLQMQKTRVSCAGARSPVDTQKHRSCCVGVRISRVSK